MEELRRDVINIDAELLRRSSQSALHAAEQTRLHIASEFGANVPSIMETLKSEGPYGYVIFPDVQPDGSVRLPIHTTREEIRQAYELTWATSHMLAFQPVIELRGTWYTFNEALSTVRLNDTGTVIISEVVSLICASNVSVKGITGEAVWARVPRAQLGCAPKATDASADEKMLRCQLLELHDRYLQALRVADVEGILDVMHDGAQAPVRDYVNDTGALVSLDGKEAHRAYFRSFFEKYRLESVDLLDRISQGWYLFSELRLTGRLRARADATVAFHTAELFVPANDGRFIARIGHGTDPA